MSRFQGFWFSPDSQRIAYQVRFRVRFRIACSSFALGTASKCVGDFEFAASFDSARSSLILRILCTLRAHCELAAGRNHIRNICIVAPFISGVSSIRIAIVGERHSRHGDDAHSGRRQTRTTTNRLSL